VRKLSGLKCRLVSAVLATVKPEWCLFLYGAQMFHLPNVERVISGRMDVNDLAGDIRYGSLDAGIALVPDERNLVMPPLRCLDCSWSMFSPEALHPMKRCFTCQRTRTIAHLLTEQPPLLRNHI